MKTQINLILALFVIVLLSSCGKDQIRVTPSTDISIKEHDISNFDEVRLSGEFIAEVNFSDTEESVTVEANSNLHEFIIVEKKGGALVVRTRNNTNIRGNATLKLNITTREINDFSATGESQFLIQDQLKADAVNVDLTGKSLFKADVDLEELDIRATGDSDIQLSGFAKTLDLNATGETEVMDFDFSTNQLFVTLSGESKVQMTVMEKIEITATGESSLRYKGEANIARQRLSGNSKIEHID